MNETTKKTNIKKAIALAVVSLFLLTTAVTVNAQVPDDYPIDNRATEEENEEYGSTWTIDTEGVFLLGGIVEIIPSHEPTGEEIPEFGGKSSILIIRSIRFPDLSLRLRLRGASVREWIRFDGHRHESATSVFIEVWLEDGRYACGNVPMSCKWWGKPSPDRIDIDRGPGFTVRWYDLETYPLEKIHIYAERVVDNFPPEIHDRTFEKYFFDGAEQSVVEQDVVLCSETS